MALPSAAALHVSDSERKQLLAMGRNAVCRCGIVLRINVILGAAEGIS